MIRHAYCRLPLPMAYVIAEPCIGTKDNSCVEVCPVDCIHPTPDEPDYDAVEMLYIDPEECIDCDACVEACPVDACFAEDQLPEEWSSFAKINADYFTEQGLSGSQATSGRRRSAIAGPVVGINPSLRVGRGGADFARPGNRSGRRCHISGFTRQRTSPTRTLASALGWASRPRRWPDARGGCVFTPMSCAAAGAARGAASPAGSPRLRGRPRRDGLADGVRRPKRSSASGARPSAAGRSGSCRTRAG